MKSHQVLRAGLALSAVLLIGTSLFAAGDKAGLQVTPVTLDRLDLRWAAAAGAERYNVYQSTSQGFTTSDDNWVASTSGTSYAKRELMPATTYYFQVRPLTGEKEQDPLAGSGTTRHKDLALVTNGTQRIVEGDAFQVVWDVKRGGEIVEIKQYDGADWVSLLATGDTVPGYAIRDRQGQNYFLRNGAEDASVRVIKDTPDEVALRFAGSPRTAEGKASALRIAQTYRIFREGILFCDLDITLPAGAEPLDLAYAELGLRLDRRLTATKFRWGYFNRSSWQLQTWKSATDEVIEKCMYPYAAADYGLSPAASFTNHVAVFIEDWRALAGAKESAGCRFAPAKDGGMDYRWILFEGNGRIQAPYSYRNRWGLGLGAMRKSPRLNLSASRGNNLIGARYYHASPRQGLPAGASSDDWPWYFQPKFWSKPAPDDVFPSNETIDEAARMGANVFVLHQSWMRCGGSNNWPPADYTPQNPQELKRVIDRCHSHNMRFGLYMRGTEAYALYMPYWEQFCKYDFDGLYVDWNGPFYYNMPPQGCFRPTETHFHAYDYFRYTKMLRKRVGENGFLIGHTGACPNLLALAVFDTYLPGEFAEQKARLLDSPDIHVYFGMGTSCGTTPISYTAPHDRAVAYSAGLGTWLQMEQGPLWQILRSVPMEKAWLYNSLTENLQVVSSTDTDFHTTVYKIDRDLLLVVTANFGPAASTTLRLDTAALGMVGTYTATPLTGQEAGNSPAPEVARMSDGVIDVPSLRQYEIRGYRLQRVAPTK